MPPSTSQRARPVTPVGIVARTLEELSEELAGTGALDERQLARLREAAELAAGLDPYLGACTTPESPALARLAERTRTEDWSARATPDGGSRLEQEMLSGHVEGQTLKFLVRLTGARRVLEVGLFTGYSALAMAEGLPDDGRVVACEIDPSVARIAGECFDASPDGHKIEVRVGAARDTLAALAKAGEVFDLVFIDADKGGYADYLGLVLGRGATGGGLLTPGGLVCVDNTLMQGQPYRSDDPTPNGAAIAAFNRDVAADDRLEQVLLPLRDGLTLIRRA